MNISVLGCGRWGSFISWYLSRQNHNVCQWGRETSRSFIELKENKKNEYVTLSDDILLTSDLEKALNISDVIIISISSQSLREFMAEIVKFDVSSKRFILCMKGLEVGSGKRLSEVLIDSGINKDNIAVWVGPGHIQSFVQGKPSCMIIDSYNPKLTKFFADSFRSDLIRFYYGDDIVGTEIGAAAKNVIGIAAGMLDGGGFSSLKGALMSRGANEVSRLIKSLGGNELSAYGLCHLGDYETTLFSEYSHNRKFGENFVKGIKFDKLAEGVETASALRFLGQKQCVDLPVTNAVYSIIVDGLEPTKAFNDIFSRSTRKEFN